ncbi:MAG: hypothetical protein ACK5PG_12240, partial [Lysobacterales bacterium]
PQAKNRLKDFLRPRRRRLPRQNPRPACLCAHPHEPGASANNGYANNNPYTYVDPDGRQSRRREERFANLGVTIAEATGLISSETADGMRAGITDGKLQPTRKPGAGATRADGIRGESQKRGPKTDPSAPHNATIRSEADRLESEGNQILAGGGRERERLVPTPGGEKSGRRPDILYQTPEGEVRATNVGRTNADGTPVKREVSAMNDLNQAGVPTDFKPYDR